MMKLHRINKARNQTEL